MLHFIALYSPKFPSVSPLNYSQINLKRKMRVTGIVTQGASRIGSAEFIKAFKVASSLDGKTYTMYRTEEERMDHVRRFVRTLQHNMSSYGLTYLLL